MTGGQINVRLVETVEQGDTLGAEFLQFGNEMDRRGELGREFEGHGNRHRGEQAFHQFQIALFHFHCGFLA